MISFTTMLQTSKYYIKFSLVKLSGMFDNTELPIEPIAAKSFKISINR